MNKYYLIYGWNLKTKKIIKPTIKEVDVNKVWILNLPKLPGLKMIKCYCSLNREDVEEMLNRTWELFSKVNLWYDEKIIENMEELCISQEKRINGEWMTDNWPEEELPF